MINAFSTLFLVLLLISSLFKIILAGRHISFIQSKRANVPDAFKENISLESHQKAADYTISKVKLSFVALFVDISLILFLTFGGGIKAIDSFALSFTTNPINQGVIFLALLFLLTSIVDLPIGIYRTFVIEVRYGFNKTTVSTWISDLLKNLIVATIIGLPLIWAIIFFMEIMGNQWWIYVWILLMVFMGFIQFVGPTYIAPLFNNFTPMENSELKARVEQLLSKCGFSSNGLFIMDGSKRSSHGNAYFTGFGNNKRIVFFDTLLERLGISEIEAVLAHELGHFRLNHVIKRLLLVSFGSIVFLAILGILKNQDWFYLGLNVNPATNNGVALGLFFIIVPVFTFMLQPMLSKMSRAHEFEADQYASQHAPAKDLVSALVKLYNDNASTLTPDPLYSAWYDSHPSASARIARLENPN